LAQLAGNERERIRRMYMASNAGVRDFLTRFSKLPPDQLLPLSVAIGRVAMNMDAGMRRVAGEVCEARDAGEVHEALFGAQARNALRRRNRR
jgi:hypothetical protein